MHYSENLQYAGSDIILLHIKVYSSCIQNAGVINAAV